jgi:hypothetical protein
MDSKYQGPPELVLGALDVYVVVGSLPPKEGEKEPQREMTQQRLSDHRRDRAEGSNAVVSEHIETYRLTFGKHKHKTVQDVRSCDPTYFAWCVLNKIHVTQCPRLKEELMKADLWDTVEKEASALRKSKTSAPSTHQVVALLKEVASLRVMQAQASEPDEPPVFREDVTGKRKRRKHTSKAIVQLHNCSACGSADHKRNTCPTLSARVKPDAASLRSVALEKVKKQAAVVARLKYTAIGQRTPTYEVRLRTSTHATFVGHRRNTCPFAKPFGGFCMCFPRSRTHRR